MTCYISPSAGLSNTGTTNIILKFLDRLPRILSLKLIHIPGIMDRPPSVGHVTSLANCFPSWKWLSVAWWRNMYIRAFPRTWWKEAWMVVIVGEVKYPLQFSRSNQRPSRVGKLWNSHLSKIRKVLKIGEPFKRQGFCNQWIIKLKLAIWSKISKMLFSYDE